MTLLATAAHRVRGWLDAVLLDLLRQLRWSFLPPLMVYFAAGAQGLTGLVGTFLVKDYLDVSAAFLAGLGFWVGLPWALKMPVGHLVDLMWRRKGLLVVLGAGLIALSIAILYGLSQRNAAMAALMAPTGWFVLASLLAPCGYVLQDAVADAMSVEAVPTLDATGAPLPPETLRALHTTMQTLGRVVLIAGVSVVAGLNIHLLADAGTLPPEAQPAAYGRVYLLAFGIPLLSVSGVLVAALQGRVSPPAEPVTVNHWYFTGGALFVALSVGLGLSDLALAQELVFLGSLAVVLWLMRQLIAPLPPEAARTLVGTALIIFAYRATPLPGPGLTWFEIDILGFDGGFLSVLSLLTSVLTLVGMLVLRPLIAGGTIVQVVVVLTVIEALLALPNIGMAYGLHHWTAAMTGGMVDARFIAVLDTAAESPLGQVAMIPMLAWIARAAPSALKATFFAVMASFTNLALSASSLATKYLNQIFVISRETRDATGAVTGAADYAALGPLLIAAAAVALTLPVLTVVLVQFSVLRSRD